MLNNQIGQWVLRLEDGTSISQENLETNEGKSWDNFSNRVCINNRIYWLANKFNGKRIKSVSLYFMGRIYTISTKTLGDNANLAYFYHQHHASKTCINGVDGDVTICSREIGLVYGNVLVSKTISLKDGSETTRILDIKENSND